MKFLLTNDDGITAPGIEALFAAVRFCFGSDAEVIVVAPDRARSECGHSITSGRPLRLHEIRPGWFSVDGTPVDCVRTALSLPLAADVDFVLSGVNAGANLGIDLLVSGTFAAAREAALQGRPAMACSHYRRPDVPKTWDHVGRWMSPILEDFVESAARHVEGEKLEAEADPMNIDHGESPGPGMLWNVNLPAIDPQSAVPRRTICPVDRCPMQRSARAVHGDFPVANREGTEKPQHLHIVGEEPDRQASEPSLEHDRSLRSDWVELQSDFHGRPRQIGTDVDLCFAGSLTISQVEPHLF